MKQVQLAAAMAAAESAAVKAAVKTYQVDEQHLIDMCQGILLVQWLWAVLFPQCKRSTIIGMIPLGVILHQDTIQPFSASGFTEY